MFAEITLEQFENEMSDMGFAQKNLDGVKEFAFSREIPNTPFSVLVFSSIDIRTNLTRDNGKDAIRITLWNNRTNRPIKVEKRVNRVGEVIEVLSRTRQRCRDIWSLHTKNHCNKCDDGIMVTRKIKRGDNKGKTFQGCSNFPECNNTIWDN